MINEDAIERFDRLLLEAMSTKRSTKFRTLLHIVIPEDDKAISLALLRYAKQQRVVGHVFGEVMKLRLAQLVEQQRCVLHKSGDGWRRLDVLEELRRLG